MSPHSADSVVHAVLYGQGWLQIGQLLLAFVLSSAIGLERQWSGKSAGLRTQAIVGTSAALLILVSKYGFMDVLVPGQIELDPSRVAAQIVTGVGFLGAGLILTRHGTVRGLTTAAAVWETAAIGMAAGAGLWLLALVVTVLHFLSVLGYSFLEQRLRRRSKGTVLLQITYLDGHGVLRAILETMTAQKWEVYGIESQQKEARTPTSHEQLVTLRLDVRGPSSSSHIVEALSDLDGVHGAREVLEEDLG